MKLERVTAVNGSWQELMTDWEAQCAEYSENLSDYAIASLPVLAELATGAQLKNAGVYVLKDGANHLAACQANVAFLPGYTGQVLRIRHITLSPSYDFSDDIPLDNYANVLVSIFTGSVELALGEMPAEHAKFHLRSPAEREFADRFVQALEGNSSFENVCLKGSWVYLSIT
ncbi:hypothetical protein [Leisingera caerulea]|uniref:hypothetical protein n=1 Tax=Leisingera caerulea TaxID=506591 RepID=UPI0021A58D23|nr:hypothetical protein [Leisingera caerulea]UWQ83192.1 hypothetical protein K3726_16250 [Leisingera caerulea]